MEGKLEGLPRELVDLAYDAIMANRLDGTIEFWNRGAEQTYGWPASDAIGRISHDLLKTEFPAPLKEIRADLARTGAWTGELRHLTRLGEQITVSSRWAVRRDHEGHPIGFLEINRDITERKRAETERERQVHLALAIGSALAQEAPLDSMLRRCTEALVAHLQVALARIWIADLERGILELRASSGQYTHLNGA